MIALKKISRVCRKLYKLPFQSIPNYSESINIATKRSAALGQCYCTYLPRPNIENVHAFGVVEKLVDVNIFDESTYNLKSTDEAVCSIDSATDNELANILKTLKNEDRSSNSFNATWTRIDAECLKRFPDWPPEKALAYSMLFYHLGVTKSSSFVWGCLKKYCKCLGKLNKDVVVQVMFIASVYRKFPDNIDDFDREFSLIEHFNKMTLEEMAIVSLAYFKCQKRLRNSTIMAEILRKLIEKIDQVDSFALAMLSKAIRYSLPLSLSDELHVLQEKLVNQLPRINLISLTHTALVGSNILVCHEGLIRGINHILKSNMSKIRLKDMERMLLVMSMFDVRDEELFEMICNELDNREEEINKFPKSFISLVNYLVVLRIYKPKLLNKALSIDFVKGNYDGNYRKLGGPLIFIDKSVEIECPQYDGNRLNDNIVRNSAKAMFYQSIAAAGSTTKKFSFNLESILHDMYGSANVTYIGVLPHFIYPDFVIGFDKKQKQPLPVSSDWSVHRWGEIKQLPDNTHHWLVVICAGWNMVQRNTETPLGTLQTKIRQLKTIGFNPVVVSYLQWKRENDKKAYVKNLMDQKLSEIYGNH